MPLERGGLSRGLRTLRSDLLNLFRGKDAHRTPPGYRAWKFRHTATSVADSTCLSQKEIEGVGPQAQQLEGYGGTRKPLLEARVVIEPTNVFSVINSESTPMREWRNWQTRRTQNPQGREGSISFSGTNHAMRSPPESDGGRNVADSPRVQQVPGCEPQHAHAANQEPQDRRYQDGWWLAFPVGRYRAFCSASDAE